MTSGRIFCAVGVVFALIAGRAWADPLVIRVSWSVIPGQFAPLIPLMPKYGTDVLQHYGKSYIVEPVRLLGGGASLTALATGDHDLDTSSPPTLVLGVTQAKLDLRVIAQQVATEVPDYLYSYFWVRAADVHTIDDLRGKAIAVPGLGGNPDVAAKMIMRAHKMTPPNDYQLVELPFTAMIPALQSRRVDAGILVPPFNVLAEKDNTLKPLFSVHDAMGAVETVFWMAKADYVAAHRAALVDFIEDNIRMRRWMFDPKTRDDAIKMVSDFTKIPANDYSAWIFTHKDYYYPPDALTDVAVLQHNVDVMYEAGVVPSKIDVAPYVDMSLAKEAAARVKP